MPAERMRSGIPGLDELIEGGVPRGSVTLVSGTPGTGKTLFCLQMLVNGCLEGEKGMLISLEQKEKDIVSQASRFNWNVQKLVADGMLKLHYIDILDDENIFDTIRNEVTKNGVKRLAIDSLTALQNYPAMLRNADKLKIVVSQSEKIRLVMHERSIRRMLTHYLIEALKEQEGTTTFLISDVKKDAKSMSSDGVSDFLCDGVIQLRLSEVGTEAARVIKIGKLRSTKHPLDEMPFEITKTGIEVQSFEKS